MSIYPKHLTIETSAYCNLKCVMCDQSLNGEGIQKRIAKLKKEHIDQIKDFMRHASKIQLHGIGEPFVSEIFWELLQYIPDNCMGEVNTNFTILDDDKINKILNSKLCRLLISLDSPRKETYYNIRGFDLDKVIYNIKKFISKKNRNIEIILNMTLMKENIDQITEMLDLCKYLNCDHVEIWPLNNYGKERNKEFFSKRGNWIFNYEEQGPWNFKYYYNKKIDEAEEYAKKNNLILLTWCARI